MRARRYAASYDARRGSVRIWLLGIVRNAVLDRVRVSSRQRDLPVDEMRRLAVLDIAPDAADIVGERDETARVIAELRALPAEQRDTLAAVTLYGFTAREVSEASNVPLGTVKTRIRLGLRRRRDRLGARVA